MIAVDNVVAFVLVNVALMSPVMLALILVVPVPVNVNISALAGVNNSTSLQSSKVSTVNI